MQSPRNFKPYVVSLAVLCMMLPFIQVKAQFYIGVEGGYNKNYAVTNNSNRAFTNYKPLPGFNVGIPIQYHVNTWLTIAADPSYMQENYRQERSAFFAGVYQNTYNSYIGLPLTAHIVFGGKRLKGFAEAGISVAYWASSRVKGVIPDILDITSGTGNGSTILSYENPYSYDEKHVFDSKADNRFQAAWVGGLGITYDINKRFQVFAAGRILYDFTDQQKNYEINQVPRYNTTYSIYAGVITPLKLNLKKNKK